MPLLSLSVSPGGLRAAAVDVGTAALYLGFASAHASAFAARPRASILMIVALETLFALFLLIRRPASVVAARPVDWSSTVAGTLLPLLLRPSAGDDAIGGQVVQTVGTAAALAGILSLNRSVGLLPANRGVVSRGAYGVVRHPLYASYTLSHAGYLWNHPTLPNALVAVATLAAQLVRIAREERLLAADPDYAAYRARTRWRLLPFVY